MRYAKLLAYVYVTLSVASSALCALEFGSMGNTSASMGGAGVALKHSAWGLYYNPALLSSDPRVKLGYSLGIGLKEQNLARLTTIDIGNMQDTAERLISTFTNTGGVGAGEINNIVNSALDSVLKGNGQTPSGDIQQDLQTYLQNKQDKDYSDIISAMLNAVQNSGTLNQAQKDLLDNIVGNIDYENLNFGAGGSDILSSITIAKGGDSGLDKAVSDISAVQDILKSNNLNVLSQNGVVLQLSSKTMNEKFGSLGVALFSSIYSSMSIKADTSRMRLIVNGGGGYYELIDNGGSYTYQASNKSDYEKYSIIASLQGNSDAHKLISTSFILTEVPVGYAHTFYLRNGNINVGVAGKLMNAQSVQNQININTNIDIANELKQFASLNNAISSNDIGVDVGVLYEIDLPKFRYLTFGLVGKNLNSPKFQSTYDIITIKPQYRLGVGFNSQFFNFAFDADLTPNDILAFSNIKQQSQMIGGGVGFGFRAFDLRLGAMKDLRQDTGLILTGGVNLFGFLDIALQTSTRFMQVENYKVPSYINLRVGGSFSF